MEGRVGRVWSGVKKVEWESGEVSVVLLRVRRGATEGMNVGSMGSMVGMWREEMWRNEIDDDVGISMIGVLQKL